MACRLNECLTLLLCAMLLACAPAYAGHRLEDLAGSAPDDGPGGTFLPAGQAFRPSWVWVTDDRLVARFQVAPGYYLYRDRLRVLAQDRSQTLDVKLELPPGDTKSDPYFGPQQVFHHDFEVSITFAPAAAGARRPPFDVLWQGCAEAGLCYPPQRQSFTADAH